MINQTGRFRIYFQTGFLSCLHSRRHVQVRIGTAQQPSSPAAPAFRRSPLGLPSQPPVGPAAPPLPPGLHPGVSQPCSLLQGGCHPTSPGQSQLTLAVVVHACAVVSGSSAQWTVARQDLPAAGFQGILPS